MNEEIVYILRFLLAALCGSLIGLERQKRAKTAGVHTHAIVASTSALMMIVSKYGFSDVLSCEGISVDASRIAAGVVSAIGFIAAGVVLIRDENVTGVTTAAGLWATVAMGLTIGAGMYVTGFAFTLAIIVMHFIRRK